MKTAVKLVPISDACTSSECEDEEWCIHDVELVAQRAREEMREMAAQKIIDSLDENSSQMWFIRDAVRALPVKP